MISLVNTDPIDTVQSEATALLEAGITQQSREAATAASRAAKATAIADSLSGTTLGSSSTKLNANPLGIGPTPAPPFVQPGTANPTPNAAVGVQVEANHNPLKIVAPLPAYVQPGQAAPPAPVSGQLSGSIPGMLGTSGAVRADGTRIF